MKEDLVGSWIPSGEMPRQEGVRNYELVVNEDMSASYISTDAYKGKDKFRLNCKYKPSTSQDSIFIYYCYLKELHLITLALGGWQSESGELLFGYEYWLGSPRPGQIHGGLPVSLSKK
ncbi:hypothetical protein [Teredinibacter purpureus]|uniref:hypothetical protein n=1 Tax=Teredinibacter purpureus TaxID=2731756 RepID=UPI0013C4BDCC|nr:hypothetical protein [Teredinibacter purpureus]